MRPEQDGCDHDYPGQVGDTGVSCGDGGRESHDLNRKKKPDARFIRANQGLIRVDLFIT